MTSSIVSMTIGMPEKAENTKSATYEHKSVCSKEHSNELTCCGHTAKKCFGEKVRPSAGLCMIAFAVPLIVPGITLTVVAFENESGMTRYSGLHILGMVLLVLAIVLTTCGILLNTTFQSKMTPYESPQQLSTQEKMVKEDNLNILVKPSTSEYPHKNTALLAVCVPASPSASHVVQTNDNFEITTTPTPTEIDTYSNTDQKYVNSSVRNGSKRQRSSNKNFEDYSSSFDSFDSDNYSSGSYVISEDVLLEKTPHEVESVMNNIREMGTLPSFSTFKPGQFVKSMFNFEDITSHNSNAIGHSVDIPENNLHEVLIDKTPFIHERIDGNTQPVHNNRDTCLTEISQTTNESFGIKAELQTETHSPGPRRRLHGLSSDSCVTPSDFLLTSCDLFKVQDVASVENVSGSSSSVFYLEQVAKPLLDKRLDDCTKEIAYNQKIKSTDNKTWAQSPIAKRPHSFPVGGEKTGGTGLTVRNNSLNETYISSLDEFSR